MIHGPWKGPSHCSSPERWPVPTAAVGRLRRIAAWQDAWCVAVVPGRWGQPRRPGVSGAPDRGAQVALWALAWLRWLPWRRCWQPGTSSGSDSLRRPSAFHLIPSQEPQDCSEPCATEIHKGPQGLARLLFQGRPIARITAPWHRPPWEHNGIAWPFTEAPLGEPLAMF